MIPPFDSRTGYLPPGIHDGTWSEVKTRFGGNPHRRRLIAGLRRVLRHLGQAGCGSILLNGSFVTNKPAPNDYDAAWEPAHVDPDRLDPVLLDFSNGRAAMKRKYGGELFPAGGRAIADMTFRDLFQRDRDGARKGIVRIDPRSVK